ncbi:thiamine-phosphate synthase family protein [Haladaptatus sp. AB643]|uniref:thiamine-phosphate synthase family protein n=1 Tax=unclassified Haladaptatus TaxID=2622732 RepID=UPI00209C48C2|nr:helix-turn-helix domain-containing protein [Haladaptatus sp. AB643]MCO8253727.1 helix-turn-helix domain-containing protein [Haladaptatus sp. AB618]
MRFAEEVVVEEFLPTFRSMLAEDLRERGLTQSEVADALGISQSAVSKYAHGDVAGNERVREDERVARLVDEIGEGLATESMSQLQALVEVEVLIRRLEDRDLIAQLHEEAMPELAGYGGDFNVHDPDDELRATERVLSSMRRGVHIVEGTSGFTSLIPAVGSNLCECLPNAESIDDVAGIPGRIFDVKGRATIPADPEFGVSGHVASILLAARNEGADVHAALNIRYAPEIVERLESTGRATAEFDAEYDDLGTAIETALDGTPDATVLYQTGGYGIEPIVYVLGNSAEEVAEIAREIV